MNKWRFKLGFLVCIIAISSMARAEEIHYDLYALGAKVADTQIHIITNKNGEFIIKSAGRTIEPIDLLIKWRGDAEVVGEIKNNKWIPKKFTYNSAWRGKDNGAQMEWVNGELKITSIKRPLENIEPADIADAVDPYTYLVNTGILLQKNGARECNSDKKIFDGRRLTIFHSTPAQRADYERMQLPESTIMCRVWFEKIGGFDAQNAKKLDPSKEFTLMAYKSLPGYFLPDSVLAQGSFVAIIAKYRVEN